VPTAGESIVSRLLIAGRSGETLTSHPESVTAERILTRITSRVSRREMLPFGVAEDLDIFFGIL